VTDKTYLIEDSSNGIAAYYSAKIARDHGGALGWSHDAEDATRFSSKELALSFAEQRMPGLQVRVIEGKPA
jgi:hypothetical protein